MKIDRVPLKKGGYICRARLENVTIFAATFGTLARILENITVYAQPDCAYK